MHLLFLEAEDALFVQGAIEIELPSFNEEPIRESWRVRLQQLLRSFQFLDNEGFTIRINLSEKGSLRVSLLIWVKEDNVMALEEYLESFAALNYVFPDSISCPNSREEYNKLLRSFPKHRARIDTSGFHTENVSFLCDFRVSTLLDDILTKAASRRVYCGYQINCQPYCVGADLLKAAKKNVLFMENIRGIPDRVVCVQRELVEKLQEKNILVEEIVGLSEFDDANWMSRLLMAHFQRRYGPLGFEEPEMKFSNRGYRQAVERGRHSITFSELPWDEICGSMEAHESGEKLFAWICSAYSRNAISDQNGIEEKIAMNDASKQHKDVEEDDQNRHKRSDLPVSYRRNRVFISYSHHDEDKKWLERLQVHLKPLEREGVIERWDDTKIKPGSKWREEIAKAIDQAKVAVLLVSADFLASDFIAKDELPPLLAAAEQDGAVILPLIVRPCRFERTPKLAQFQAVNSPDKPLLRLNPAEQEETLVRVSEAVEDALRGCKPKPPKIPSCV